MVDAHCHIDLYPNPVSIVQTCERRGIYTLGMTNLPSHFDLGINYTKACKFVRLALGMHPLYAARHRLEWSLFEELLPKTSYIGEVGLDFSSEGVSTKIQQIESFRFILDQVRDRKIVSVHSRGAEMNVLEMLGQYQVPHAIFHWFTGSVEQVRQAVAAGYYFSINPAMIRSEKGKAIIRTIPLFQLLTESDGPFVKIQQRSIEPTDIQLVYPYLAQLHETTIDKVTTQIKANFLHLINTALR